MKSTNRILACLSLLMMTAILMTSHSFANPGQQKSKAQTKDGMKQFWGKFQAAGAHGDKKEIIAMTQFPLKHGGWLAGRYDDSPLKKEEFEKHFSELFTPAISNLISAKKANDLEARNADGQLTYRLTLIEKSASTDDDDTGGSAYIFDFCPKAETYEICGLWMAG